MVSIVEEIKNQLDYFRKSRESLEALDPKIPEVGYLKIILESQIRDYNTRLNKLVVGKYPYQCTLCDGNIKAEESHSILGKLTICQNCLKTIQQMITAAEFEEKYDLTKGTVKQDCKPSRCVLKPYIDAGLVRKSGGNWLIHETVYELHYSSRRKS